MIWRMNQLARAAKALAPSARTGKRRPLAERQVATREEMALLEAGLLSRN